MYLVQTTELGDTTVNMKLLQFHFLIRQAYYFLLLNWILKPKYVCEVLKNQTSSKSFSKRLQ